MMQGVFIDIVYDMKNLSRVTISSQINIFGLWTGHVTSFGGKLLTDVTLSPKSASKPWDVLLLSDTSTTGTRGILAQCFWTRRRN